MKKTFSILSLLVLFSFLVTGCGETVNGMVKDGKRIGSGIKKVFVQDE